MRKILKALNLDPSAFEPFGQAVALPAKMHEETDELVQHWRELAEVSFPKKTEVSIFQIKKRKPLLEEMERHIATPEFLIPLDSDIILALAPNEILTEIPVEKVSAFLVRQGEAVIINPGIWHSLPFPLEENVRYLSLAKKNTYKADYYQNLLEGGGEVEIYLKNIIYSYEKLTPHKANWALAALGFAGGLFLVDKLFRKRGK